MTSNAHEAMDEFRVMLRRLTVRDDRFVEAVLGDEAENLAASGLDPKSHALVLLGSLIALDAAPQSYAATVEAARHAGASCEEIVGVLVAALPVVGVPRVVSAAPKLGLALGYDLDEALEAQTTGAEPPSHGRDDDGLSNQTEGEAPDGATASPG